MSSWNVSPEGKSWDPELFRDFSKIVDVGREALRAAQVSAAQIDAVIVATATPYEVQLDSDGFRLLRGLGIPDHALRSSSPPDAPAWPAR